MSTVFSSSPTSLGMPAGAPTRVRRFDSAHGLAALLLAAVVAALVVLADQLIDTWVDGHLFLGWVALWVVIFAGSALFAGAARRVAHRTMVSLDGWSHALAEARAEVRLWEMAKMDPKLKAKLVRARAAKQAAEAAAAEEAANDYGQALAPMGLEAGMTTPQSVQRERQLTSALPYI